MPLMGSLYIGSSGLQTSQNALNTTAHNLANKDTVGYVRQQVLLGDSIYNTIQVNSKGISNQQIGVGVIYAKVRQVRDVFLDQTYRKESGRSAFYEASVDALEEVEDVLGEMNGVAFSGVMEDLYYAVQELAKQPDDSVTQGLFVQRAATFIERANAVYQGLCEYQDNLNLQVKSAVTNINNIGNKIKILNDQIRNIEVGGIESPNDLIDARNQLLDELASYANISYSEDIDGSVLVKIEGEAFVTRDIVFEMGLDMDSTTGFYTPFWPQNATYTLNDNGTKKYNINGAHVFDLTQTISTELDSDVGSLKAMYLARGDHRATYSDIQDTEYYNQSISQSIVMNIQAEFDQLIHAVTSAINKVLSDASDPSTGYLCNDDGTPIQLFTFVAGEDYTVTNLQINQELMQMPTRLGFVRPDEKVDFEVGEKLLAAFDAEEYTLNPNVKKKNNFVDYYSDLVSQVGNTGKVFKSIAYTQNLSVQSAEASRQQIVGVSSDEELSNMIMYQNAFNASSRYVNAISEMLEHIINTLGS